MKFFVFALVFAIGTFSYPTMEAVVVKLNAVSSSLMATDLYLTIKKDALPQSEQKISPETQTEICRSIMNSSLLKRSYVEAVDLNEIDIFRKENPEAFENLPSLDREMLLTYATKPMTVFVPSTEEKFLENVFICLHRREAFGIGNSGIAEEYKKNALVEYFISEEYNMNFKSDSATKRIAGRFVFKRSNSDKNRIDLRAIAEEPAIEISVPGVDVEHLYLQRRSNKNPVVDKLYDPLCKLNQDERLRVCALIFGSAYFDDEKVLALTYAAVDTSCYEDKLVFQDEDLKANNATDRFKEWAIRCRGSKTYLVSRAYNDSSENALSSNDVFLYEVISEDGLFQKATASLVSVMTNMRLEVM